MSLINRAWNNPYILAATGITCLGLAFQPMFEEFWSESLTHSCQSQFGKAAMGLDDHNASFVTLTDRFGRTTYESSRMHLPKTRREIVDQFCETGETPPVRKEFVTAAYPPIYMCEGFLNQKAAVFPLSQASVRIIRSHPSDKPMEVINGQLMTGAWLARQHCAGPR